MATIISLICNSSYLSRARFGVNPSKATLIILMQSMNLRQSNRDFDVCHLLEGTMRRHQRCKQARIDTYGILTSIVVQILGERAHNESLIVRRLCIE